MWWQLLWSFLLAVVGQLLAPKPPKPEDAAIQNPDGIASVDDVTPVCVLFGSRELKQQVNVVWYGDLKTTPIKTGGGGKKG